MAKHYYVVHRSRTPILNPIHIEQSSVLMTDDFLSYKYVGQDFKEHNYIGHGKKQYSDGAVHVNTAESYFSLLKKGILGTFYHVSKKHLNRFIGEFDFRFNHIKTEDHERFIYAVLGIGEMRLYYKKI